jgi:protein-S-isoprenylcysteine O-methyltransferase Ste14
MTVIALVLFVAFLVLVGEVRPLLQVRRTGDLGDRRRAARRNPIQRRIDALAAVGAMAVGVASPVAALLGLDPVVDSRSLAIIGLALAVLGSIATFSAQLAMGDAWRVGVDPDERTPLVTAGPFALVRNPIMTATLVTSVGLTLMVPTVVALLGLAAIVAATQLLVRLDEEPHLRRVHSEEYARYAAAVGRFLPGIGRLEQPGSCCSGPCSVRPYRLWSRPCCGSPGRSTWPAPMSRPARWWARSSAPSS